MKDRLISITKLDHATSTTTTEYTIVYSTSYIGNPSTINGINLSFKGRQLAAVGSTNYEYDEAGNRVIKNVNGDVTHYFYSKNALRSVLHNDDKLTFHYNEKGLVVGFEYDKKDYFYLRDLTGNITSIINSANESIVDYKYDAWGNWINQSSASNGSSIGNLLAELNPYLYKGYVYDNDTNWYYLKNRFYSPVLRRFINSDGVNTVIKTTTSLNVYSYCFNNPITYKDETGNFPFIAFAIIGVVLLLTLKADNPDTVKRQEEAYEEKVVDYIEEYSLDIDENGVAKINYNGEDITIKIYRDNIHIEESHFIKDRALMEALLRQIINSDYFNSDEVSKELRDRPISGMIFEWEVHNLFYEIGIFTDNTRSVDLDLRDRWFFDFLR